jgi:hypothetical protein
MIEVLDYRGFNILVMDSAKSLASFLTLYMHTPEEHSKHSRTLESSQIASFSDRRNTYDISE